MPTRKQRGRESEEIVAAYLRDHGFPHAERRPASLPGSDITGLVGMDVEVKARRGLDLGALMRQQEARCGAGTLAWAVVRPDGAGPATVARWPVVLPLAAMVDLLRAAGHGEAL